MKANYHTACISSRVTRSSTYFKSFSSIVEFWSYLNKFSQTFFIVILLILFTIRFCRLVCVIKPSSSVADGFVRSSDPSKQLIDPPYTVQKYSEYNAPSRDVEGFSFIPQLDYPSVRDGNDVNILMRMGDWKILKPLR